MPLLVLPADAMSLQIGSAFRDGFERTVSPNGLLLMGIFLVFSAVNTVLSQSASLAVQQYLQEFPVQSAQLGPASFGTGEAALAVSLPLSVVSILTLITVFIAEALRIVGIRMFAPDETLSPAADSIRDGLPFAVLNGVAGGIIATVLTYIGLVLLVVPGVFIALSFFFARQEIALQNKNFVDALRDSWAMTRGERLGLFVLGALLFVVSLIANSPATVLFFLSPLAALVVGMVTSAVTTVFGIAVVTRAYQQIKADGQELDSGPTSADTTQGGVDLS
ncbi:hypothetical protein ACFQL1_06870 [Halomicroarcula sp. GCM10025709]|uniref:hypothetical protein n=1 Tax=Haloarcula TaxID=2237 RepID=UPI0024C328CE|nr:hypothetical protein [Halomicroarcula sp. YJ-61-S]